MKTRTGNFPLGFRRGGTDWQKNLPSLIGWAKENALEVIDLGRDAVEGAPAARAAGLRVGSIDLFDNKNMISPDQGKRSAAIAANRDFIQACAGDVPPTFS